MAWLVKHRLRDQSVETFRYESQAKARRICCDLQEVDEVAWVQDEQGRTVPEWRDRLG